MFRQDFGYVHLSAGDLLREERATPGSQYGEMIETHIRNGTIVPVEVTCSLIEKAIQKHVAAQNLNITGGDHSVRHSGRFLIDGFPRNRNNLDGWERCMSDKVTFQFVLFLVCSEDECVRRCLQRGASGSGRSDDNETSLRKRMHTYSNDTLPIIEHYETLGMVRRVDALLKPETVYEQIQQIFSKAL